MEGLILLQILKNSYPSQWSLEKVDLGEPVVLDVPSAATPVTTSPLASVG